MKFQRKASKRVAIDMTPLIDVVFLLLLFFMITTSFIGNFGIKVKLPQTKSKTQSFDAKPLEVTINRKNQFFFNGKKISRRRLFRAFKRVPDKQKKEVLIIRADGNVFHKHLVYVMDQARLAGIFRLSIATTPSKK
ncbi:MAG: biopolymer transport protein ExbD [bacterium]|jgi:biopolymer transport protein ExbD